MEYQQTGEFRLSWKLSVILNIIAGVIFTAGFYGFFYIYLKYSDDSYGIRLLENSNLLIAYILIFIQVAIHEYSHAIGYKLSGGRVSYGIKWLCPYCREVSGIYYPARNFIITLILPVVTGTVIGLIVIALLPQFLYYTIVCMLANLSGAAGDMMMLFYVIIRKRKGEFIKDEDYGFSIHRRVAAEI